MHIHTSLEDANRSVKGREVNPKIPGRPTPANQTQVDAEAGRRLADALGGKKLSFLVADQFDAFLDLLIGLPHAGTKLMPFRSINTTLCATG